MATMTSNAKLALTSLNLSGNVVEERGIYCIRFTLEKFSILLYFAYEEFALLYRLFHCFSFSYMLLPIMF